MLEIVMGVHARTTSGPQADDDFVIVAFTVPARDSDEAAVLP